MAQKGFFAALFDLSFSKFIAPWVIKVLYVAGIILIAVLVIFRVLGMFVEIPLNMLEVMGQAMRWVGVIFSPNPYLTVTEKIVAAVLSPFVFLLYVIFLRMWAELLVVFFRIAENTKHLIHHKE